MATELYRDLLGFIYDDDVPAFITFGDGNVLEYDGRQKFYFHRPTMQLLDALAVERLRAARNWSWRPNEIGEANDWLWEALGFGAATPKPDAPTITVTGGGVVTPFSRGGVSYIQIAFLEAGGFNLSTPLLQHRRALGAGGATGGRSALNSVYIPGAGGAGGLIQALDLPLAAGSYTVNIGKGGQSTSAPGSASGEDSVLTNVTTAMVERAVGGGYGGISNDWNAAASGGSGGGGRAQQGATAMFAGGAGTDGQGYTGSRSYSSLVAEECASGGSGGAGGAATNAGVGVPGTAGPGVLLDWLETPILVCAGERGITLADSGLSTENKTYGSGSRGAHNGTNGNGGDGFFFLRVRASDVVVN